MHKTCPVCQQSLSLDNFSFRTGGKYLKSACRLCSSKQAREYQVKNADKFKKYQKKYNDAKKTKLLPDQK